MLAITLILCAALFVIGSLYFGNLLLELEELSRRSRQQLDNDEFDYGHEVNYKEEEE